MGTKQYCVYILTNSRRTVLYTGVTNNMERRLSEHKDKLGSAFTRKYNVDQLVYYESTNSVIAAIEREKELKNWRRSRKLGLINASNPEWKDLAAQW